MSVMSHCSLYCYLILLLGAKSIHATFLVNRSSLSSALNTVAASVKKFQEIMEKLFNFDSGPAAGPEKIFSPEVLE